MTTVTYMREYCIRSRDTGLIVSIYSLLTLTILALREESGRLAREALL